MKKWQLWLLFLAIGFNVVAALGTVVSILIFTHHPDWLGFAGGIGGGAIGGALTVAAGVLAWAAVQDQIAAAKELAQAEEKRAVSIASRYAVAVGSEMNRLVKKIDKAINTTPYSSPDVNNFFRSFHSEYFNNKSNVDQDLEWACARLPMRVLDATRQLQRAVAKLDKMIIPNFDGGTINEVTISARKADDAASSVHAAVMHWEND